MHITFISHASVVIETSDAVIWTDPWLFGKAFNDSWALMPEPPPGLIEAWLPKISHLFISHEHPDHFHLPTLKSLPADFKRRVQLLFQRLHTNRMTDAFRALGFERITSIGHREWATISEQTAVYMYQEFPLDSAIAVRDRRAGQMVVNVNDVELSDYDIAVLRKDLGSIDLVLNQFSFATYDGREERDRIAPEQAERILTSIADDHQGLGAKVTIPYASYMYFCTPDNFYLNRYRNTPRMVAERFVQRGEKLVVLLPGDTYELGADWDNRGALAAYDAMQQVPEPHGTPPRVELSALEESARTLFDNLHRYYPSSLLRLTGEYRIRLEDLGVTVRFAVGSKTWRLAGPGDVDWDVSVLSQPLDFALRQTFGMQTLSISGRFVLRRHMRQFMLLRVLMGLRNAEIYLRPRFVLTAPLRPFFLSNLSRLAGQAVGTIKVLRTFVGSSS